MVIRVSEIRPIRAARIRSDAHGCGFRVLLSPLAVRKALSITDYRPFPLGAERGGARGQRCAARSPCGRANVLKPRGDRRARVAASAHLDDARVKPGLVSIPGLTADRRYRLRYRNRRCLNLVANAPQGVRGVGAPRIEAVSIPKYRTLEISKGPNRDKPRYVSPCVPLNTCTSLAVSYSAIGHVPATKYRTDTYPAGAAEPHPLPFSVGAPLEARARAEAVRAAARGPNRNTRPISKLRFARLKLHSTNLKLGELESRRESQNGTMEIVVFLKVLVSGSLFDGYLVWRLTVNEELLYHIILYYGIVSYIIAYLCHIARSSRSRCCRTQTAVTTMLPTSASHLFC